MAHNRMDSHYNNFNVNIFSISQLTIHSAFFHSSTTDTVLKHFFNLSLYPVYVLCMKSKSLEDRFMIYIQTKTTNHRAATLENTLAKNIDVKA